MCGAPVPERDSLSANLCRLLVVTCCACCFHESGALQCVDVFSLHAFALFLSPLLPTVDPSSLRGVPQHFMPGVSDMPGGSFPLSGTTHALNMFGPVVHQPVSNAGPQSDKPTAAQAAAGRLQRASARQAAKAAQQQKRQAQARAAAAKGSGNATKRKKDDDDGTEEDNREGERVGTS